jgi:2'-5' RNA ligase
MKRLFIAVDIELSKEFQTLTQQLQFDLRNDEIVWTKRDLQHLTLRFIGETPEAKVKPLANILTNITSSTSPFDLQLDKMGVFGSNHSPKTLWYGFSDFTLFKNLFEKLELEMLQAGFQKKYGNFVPHISIGRIKKVDNKNRFWETIHKLQPQFKRTIPVTHLKLMISKLTSEGPTYKTLFESSLIKHNSSFNNFL